MTKFYAPHDAYPKDIKWAIEILPSPNDDEGMQTLYGPFTFDEYEDAVAFARKEFGKPKGNWRMRSIWPVFKK